MYLKLFNFYILFIFLYFLFSFSFFFENCEKIMGIIDILKDETVHVQEFTVRQTDHAPPH